MSARAVVDYLNTLRHIQHSVHITCILARHIASSRTSLAGHRVLFNQTRLRNEPIATPPNTSTPTTFVPVGCKVISSPICPDTPKHFGQTINTPFASDWLDALFQNYSKMLTTGTFSAPMLCSQLPPGKSILHPRIACHVEETSTPHQYDLYARTCADGSTQQEYIDFTDSIDSIRVLLNIAASSGLTIRLLDVSNAFQNSIIFDATERVYISLPPLFLEWFKHQWPDFPLPSQNPKDLILQCLKTIQGTQDAGRRWYILLSGCLFELKMVRSSMDHGVFIWSFNGVETCYLALATDDILFLSKTRAPFLTLH